MLRQVPDRSLVPGLRAVLGRLQLLMVEVESSNNGTAPAQTGAWPTRREVLQLQVHGMERVEAPLWEERLSADALVSLR